jgi:hypothetical protein
MQMFIGCSVIMTSIGASGAVTTSLPEDPRWTLRMVPSSTSARSIGSQCGSWKLGYPSSTGFSVNVIEWQPFAATRRISSAQSSGSHSTGRAIGMMRPGYVPAHSSMCQSL